MLGATTATGRLTFADFFFSVAGDNPLIMEVGVNTDIAGNPIVGKDYTAELAELISRTSGAVRE